MIKKISDIYLFSDVDGTLGRAGVGIPERNRIAIDRFVSKGGHFAVATGRPVEGARNFTKSININSPCILSNGCAIYDFSKDTYLYTAFLPEGAGVYLKNVLELYPHIGVSAVSPSGYFYINNVDKIVEKFGPRTHEVRMITPDEFSDDFCKIVMVVDEDEIDEVMSNLVAREYDGVEFITSDTFLLEMMPNNISKGAAIKKICELNNIPIENTVAVGDYYNDVAMLKTAGLSITVEDAPDDIKAISHMTVGKCLDGAIADVIEYLEKLYDN